MTNRQNKGSRTNRPSSSGPIWRPLYSTISRIFKNTGIRTMFLVSRSLADQESAMKSKNDFPFSGCFSRHGVGPLVKIDGIMDAPFLPKTCYLLRAWPNATRLAFPSVWWLMVTVNTGPVNTGQISKAKTPSGRIVNFFFWLPQDSRKNCWPAKGRISIVGSYYASKSAGLLQTT
jgi:hypothetical protein